MSFRYFVVAIAYLYFSSVALAHPGEVLISPTNQDFAMLSVATGRASLEGPFVILQLQNLALRSHETHERSNYVKSIRFGIARYNIKGEWVVDRWSQSVSVGQEFQKGETKTYADMKVVIPVDGISNLSRYWVVIETELNTNGKVGYCYSHSNHDVFSLAN